MDAVLNFLLQIIIITAGAIVMFFLLLPGYKIIRKHFQGKYRTKKPGNGQYTIDNEMALSIVRDIKKEAGMIMKYLTEEEKKTLIEIHSRLKPVTPSELFSGFDRTSDEQSSPHHELLRNLRKCHLIRPSVGGRWRGDKRIEITAMGRLVIQLNKNRFN